MDARLAAAFEPARAGALVRLLAAMSGGMARTRDQIGTHAAEWRREAELVLAGDLPAVGAALRSWSRLQAGDGFHPNDHGHRFWAEIFLPVVASSGRETIRPDQGGAGSPRVGT